MIAYPSPLSLERDALVALLVGNCCELTERQAMVTRILAETAMRFLLHADALAPRFDTLLVLDLDATLIHSSDSPPKDTRIQYVETANYFVWLRPDAREFLELAGKHVTLAVWTASHAEYAAEIVDALGLRDKLVFLRSREHCARRAHPDYEHRVFTKPLKKIRQFPRSRVLFLDDKPTTYAGNYGNAIPIRPWRGDPDDAALMQLIAWLPSFAAAPNVREIEKRFWEEK